MRMGGEDFSFYQQVMPGYMYLLGLQGETGEKLASAHSPHFKVNEDALPYGAALQASLAVKYLLEHQHEAPSRHTNKHDEL